MNGYKEYYELVKEETMLSSDGETQDFAKMQSKFNLMFGEDAISYNPVVETQDVWCFDVLADTEEGEEKFFDKVAEIKRIPVYKHMLIFLLLKHKLAIGEENIKGLWKYVQNNSSNMKIDSEFATEKESLFREKLKRNIDVMPCEFDETDYAILFSILFMNVKNAYVQNGYIKKFTVSDFEKLILKPTENDIHNFALAYQMDYTFLRVFRKKILRSSGINFFDRKQILLSFVIKYAKSCGEYKYFEALRKLEEKYPPIKKVKIKVEKEEKKEKNKKKKDKGREKINTTTIRKELESYLEKEGTLREELRNDFFDVEVMDANVEVFLKNVDLIEKRGRERTAEILFNQYWNEFKQHLANSDQAEIVFKYQGKSAEKTTGKNKGEQKNFGTQNVYRYLYGMNVNERKKGEGKSQERIVDLPDDSMRVLGNGREEFFLDSKLFLDTRIRDNTIQAFPADEERQRNLLLTVLFLNFVVDEDNLADCYEFRVEDFDIYTTDKLVKAGFQLMYSGNPYDAYLKILLSCDMPLELFRYIWKLKTKSEE